MKSRILVLSFFFLTISISFSQDVIYRKDGSEIRAKVTEITESAIKYVRFEQPDGPSRVIDKSNVFMIIYQDGTREVISKGNIKQPSEGLLKSPSLPKTITADTIKVWKHRYYYKGQIHNKSTVRSILKSDKMAYQHVQNSNACAYISYSLAFIGGALIGWPIGTYIGRGEPDWWLAGVGSGIAVIAFGIAVIGDAQLTKAIKVYNSNRKTIGMQQINLDIGITRNGIGIIFKF